MYGQMTPGLWRKNLSTLSCTSRKRARLGPHQRRRRQPRRLVDDHEIFRLEQHFERNRGVGRDRHARGLDDQLGASFDAVALLEATAGAAHAPGFEQRFDLLAAEAR